MNIRGLAILTALAVQMLMLSSGVASAFTDCTKTLSKVYAANTGSFWLYYTDNGRANFLINTANGPASITIAVTAIAAGHQVTVRYDADSVNCADTTTIRTDVDGLFLLQ